MVRGMSDDKAPQPKLTVREFTIAREILKEIRSRLGFLEDIGLDYLTLDRPPPPSAAASRSASAWPPRSAAG